MDLRPGNPRAEHHAVLAAYTVGVSLAYAALTLTSAKIGTASIVAFVALLLVPHYLWGRPPR